MLEVVVGDRSCAEVVSSVAPRPLGSFVEEDVGAVVAAVVNNKQTERTQSKASGPEQMERMRPTVNAREPTER